MTDEEREALKETDVPLILYSRHGSSAFLQHGACGLLLKLSHQLVHGMPSLSCSCKTHCLPLLVTVMSLGNNYDP